MVLHGTMCIHRKSGFLVFPESANYFDFPQSYSLRMRKTTKFSLFFSVFFVFLCFSLFLLLRFTHFFCKIFWTGEQNPQTFSLFGCMGLGLRDSGTPGLQDSRTPKLQDSRIATLNPSVKGLYHRKLI